MASFVQLYGSTQNGGLHPYTRKVRVSAEGYLEIAPAEDEGLLIAGVGGDDSTLAPFRQVDFVPQAGGWRSTLTAASQELGALTENKTYHITPSVDAWVLVGATGGTAVIGDGAGAGSTHVKGGATYEYVAKAGALYVQFIKDTDAAVGYIAISRVES